MGDLSDNFSSAEFACRCGCGYDDVHPRLLGFLEATRSRYGRRMVVVSGCRCRKNNRDSSGAQWSQHMGLEWDELRQMWLPTRCCAADILVSSTGERYALVGAALDAGAAGVGVAKSFVHIDCGLADPSRGIVRPALWTYS